MCASIVNMSEQKLYKNYKKKEKNMFVVALEQSEGTSTEDVHVNCEYVRTKAVQKLQIKKRKKIICLW